MLSSFRILMVLLHYCLSFFVVVVVIVLEEPKAFWFLIFCMFFFPFWKPVESLSCHHSFKFYNDESWYGSVCIDWMGRWVASIWNLLSIYLWKFLGLLIDNSSSFFSVLSFSIFYYSSLRPLIIEPLIFLFLSGIFLYLIFLLCFLYSHFSFFILPFYPFFIFLLS